MVVVGTARSKERLDVAKKTGAWATLITGKDQIVDEIRSITGNEGADVVFECAGSSSAFIDGLACVRPKGQFILLAAPRHEFSANLFPVFSKAVKVAGAASTDLLSWEVTMELGPTGNQRKRFGVEFLLSKTGLLHINHQRLM